MSYSFNTKIKFWREIFSFQSFNTKDEWIDYLPKFKNHCDIVFTYIANFDDIKLSNLTQYFVDILAETSGKCDELFNEVLQFMMFLQKEQIRMHTETFKEHEYIVKKIIVNPGGQLSLQSHEYRSEHWLIAEGNAEVIINEETFNLFENQHIFIPQGTKHRLSNRGDKNLIVIEMWFGDNLDENDIKRYEDIYKRNL